MSNKSPSIGLDLVTIFSCIGVWKTEVERFQTRWVREGLIFREERYIENGAKALVVKTSEIQYLIQKHNKFFSILY